MAWGRCGRGDRAPAISRTRRREEQRIHEKNSDRSTTGRRGVGEYASRARQKRPPEYLPARAERRSGWRSAGARSKARFATVGSQRCWETSRISETAHVRNANSDHPITAVALLVTLQAGRSSPAACQLSAVNAARQAQT